MANAKLDVLNVFDSIDNVYYNITGEVEENKIDSFSIRNMTEMNMVIETRPSYPSNKITFTTADITKGRTIRFININFWNLEGQFDLDVVLEDTQRNFLSSIITLLLYFMHVKR